MRAVVASLFLAASGAFAQSSIFGFELGSTFSGALCANAFQHPKEGFCVAPDPWKPNGPVAVNGLLTLHFKYKDLPFWTTDRLQVYLVDGKIEGIIASTGGQDSLLSVSDDLRAKFGEPTSKLPSTAQNGLGARFDNTVSVWETPGFTVTHFPLFGSTKSGRVSIFTSTGAAAYKRDIDAVTKPGARPL